MKGSEKSGAKNIILALLVARVMIVVIVGGGPYNDCSETPCVCFYTTALLPIGYSTKVEQIFPFILLYFKMGKKKGFYSVFIPTSLNICTMYWNHARMCEGKVLKYVL